MLQWCEVARMELQSETICVKDAMVMLDADTPATAFPHVKCPPGEYVFEIFVEPGQFYAHRARMLRANCDGTLGGRLGAVEVDSAYVGLVDFGLFRESVIDCFGDYEEWTAGELDDELLSNFSGEIQFNQVKLFYVKSGDGDGSYDCHELVDDGLQVGIEVAFSS